MNTKSILTTTLLLLLATMASGAQVRGLNEANQDQRLLQTSAQVAGYKNKGGGKVKTPTGPTATAPTVPTKTGGNTGGTMGGGPPTPTTAGQPSPTSVVQVVGVSFTNKPASGK